jgi:hypothetical protein
MPTSDLGVLSELSRCRAAEGCAEQTCFQVRLEALLGRRLVVHCANACAEHIGELVEGLKAWSHDGGLADGTVTVLAIDPGAEFRRAAGDVPGPLWPGFAFSTLALPHGSDALALPRTSER